MYSDVLESRAHSLLSLWIKRAYPAPDDERIAVKYLKLLALAVVAAGLMTAGDTGSASATELFCGPSMCRSEEAIHAVSEGNVTFDTPFGNIVCGASTFQAETKNTGSSTETVQAAVSTLTFSSCGSNTVEVLASGNLEIHTEGSNKNNNGTVTWTGMRVTVIHLGVHCFIETNNTDIGKLTGSATTGVNATLDLGGNVAIAEGLGDGLCGTSAPWTGSYRVTTPGVLNVD